MASKKSYEMALDIITEGAITGARSKMVQDSELSSDEFRAEGEKQFQKARPWTSEAGVQGFGIAPKVSDGQRMETLALKVYVDEKRPKSEIDNPAPSKVTLPAIGTLETDVEEIGRMEPEMFRDRVDPFMPGSSVVHTGAAGEAGTFGCVVHTTDDFDTSDYMLSNAHVLALKGIADFNTPIIQPGWLDNGTAADIVAELTSFVPFNFDPMRFMNLVDAAIAKVDVNQRQLDRNIRLLGHPPRGVARVTRIGMKVQKVGRTTDHTWGEIMDTNFRLNLFYPSPVHGGQARRVGFKDQVMCTRFTQGGDSGSAVLNESGFLIGLHFAGSPSRSVFNKISNVFDALHLKLPD